MSDLRTAAQQALEALEEYQSKGAPFLACDGAVDALRAALAQQTEPAAGKVVAWGVFANIDGEWQLQHPVFAGDEQGKVNSEFERASYSGPQPLEVRPLGVVTATAQQAEPLNLTDPAVQKRLAAQWGYVPQRKPLTEEEKRALADKFLSCQPESYEVSGVFDLISAVERAHGIKE